MISRKPEEQQRQIDKLTEAVNILGGQVAAFNGLCRSCYLPSC